MTSVEVADAPVGTRICALLGPILLLLYGVLRLINGGDGGRGPGLAWNLGHTLFLVGFVLFGVLTAGMRRLIPAHTLRTRLAVNAAAVAGLFGVACFLWVILGDLFANLHESAPLPEPLKLIGPLAFQLGWLTLLIMLATIPPRRLPMWSPILVLAGFVLFAANLNLLPIGALLLLAGLAPLTLGRRAGRSWRH